MKAKGFVALPTHAISVVSPVAREEGQVESAKEIADVAVAAHAGLDAYQFDMDRTSQKGDFRCQF